ncbi:MAG: hypothetical protein LH650_12455, partial [Chloroflexi bacterium]|nr:hypothetical protein [Chloroflexota bacterium]
MAAIRWGSLPTFIDAIGDGKVLATTTIEVVQEFLHIHAKRGRRSEATDRAQAYIRLLAPLIVVEPADLEAGICLF